MFLARTERAAVALWVLIVFSPSLNTLKSYLLWYVTLALIGQLLVMNRFSAPDCRVPVSLLAAAWGLPTAIVATALLSRQTGYDLGQAVKLALILLVVLPLCLTRPARRAALCRGAELAVYVNALLVVGGIVISPVLFGLQGFARFGTFLASPGSLWRVGAVGLGAGVMRWHSGVRFARLRGFLCLSCGAAIVALDGSRTGFLVGGLALAFSFARFLALCFRRPLWAFAALGPALLLVAFAATTPAVQDAVETYGVIARLQDAAMSSGSGRLTADSLDFTRTNMLADVSAAIIEHPLTGTGMGTTMSQTPAGLMVIHFSFLQIWADAGLLGFLSYAILCASALWLAVSRSLPIRPRCQPARIPWEGIYLSAGWMLTGCLHPISTEISEWIWFLVALAIVMDPAGRERRRVASPAPLPLSPVPEPSLCLQPT